MRELVVDKTRDTDAFVTMMADLLQQSTGGTPGGAIA